MPDWKRNLIFLWLSQFIAVACFAMCMPIAPFYIQQLGVTEPQQLKLWTSVFAAAAPVSLAIASPIWGVLSDRFGRKLMLVRAYAGATVVLTCMGFVPNVEWLIVLRIAQGFFTGTVSAATIMVAALTPDAKQGTAHGVLQSALYAGVMFGAAGGGILGDALGYQAPFLVAGALMLVALLLCLPLADPTRQQRRDADAAGAAPVAGKALMGVAWPLLGLIFFIGLARQFDLPMLPLYIQELHGQLAGAATITGWINAIGAIGALLSGLVLGRFIDRWSLWRVGTIAALAAGFFMMILGLTSYFPILFAARFMMLFFAGALDPVVQSWLARHVPAAHRGRVFGLAFTMRAVGWIFAPILSGWIATTWGLASVFLCGPMLFIAVFAAIAFCHLRLGNSAVVETTPLPEASGAN